VTKKTSDVFGMSPDVLNDSYVDRGGLDEEIKLLLGRKTHIALRGESKAGKSWLRQRLIPDAITVQCRLGRPATDIYRDALSQLDISLEIEQVDQKSVKGRIEASTSVGAKLLAKVGITAEIGGEASKETKTQKVGRDITDLRFIAELIKAGERRLVAEDFHYLSPDQRKQFAFDLKALWDYGLFVIIVGVWTETNMLLELNPDLSGRVEEVSVSWNDAELKKIITQGGNVLNIQFSDEFLSSAAHDAFGNAGILQILILKTLDALGIDGECSAVVLISDKAHFVTAAMHYADQLNPLYQQFAKQVSSGMRTRKDSTGIYSHAIAAIVAAPDEKLIKGLPIDEIFSITSSREPRIQKGNLRTILERLDSLQVDADGRGLVISYNPSVSEVSIVDKQLLLYRKYATVRWPWEDMIQECTSDESFVGG
jgi:hypothetical protein